MKTFDAPRSSFVVVVVVVFSLVICYEFYSSLIYTETNLDPESFMMMERPIDAEDPQKYLQPPSNLPYNLTPTSERLYHLNSHSFGWEFIHYYTSQIFNEQKTGFFIEAGALDGEYLSNTLWLEKEKGWIGLLLEPDPFNYRHLIWKRRKAWISKTCLSSGKRPYTTFIESYQQVSKTYAHSWLYRANSRPISSSMIKTPSEEDYFRDSSSLSYSKVSCFPMSSFLEVLNVSTVDFMSLDIQGSEWEVIKSLPLEKVRFRVLAVEHYLNAKTQTERKAIDWDFVKFMDKIGFKFLEKDGEPNYIFVMKGDPVLKTKYEPFFKPKS